MVYLFGCNELDEMFGSLDPGTMLLIEGPPGAGKTIFVLSLIYRNARNGRKALYLTFNEDKFKLLAISKRIGLDLSDAVDKGMIKITRIPMVKDLELVNFISKMVVEGFESFDIVVIDSVTPILKLLESYAAKRSWLQSVLYEFVSRGKGLLILVADMLQQEDPDLKLLEYVADVVIELKYRCSGIIERSMVFKKFRGKEIQVSTIPFDISRGGLILLNYISRDVVQRARRSISVDCPCLKKALPETLRAGTAIFIADRTTIFGRTYLHRWLHEKSIEWLKQGYRIAFLSYNPRYVEIIERCVKEAGVRDNAYIKYLNPLMLAPSIVVREEIRACKEFGADIVFVLDIEKVYHAYSQYREELYRYALYSINALRDLGAITIRYYNLGMDRAMPSVYVDWCDIVLEIYRDPSGRIVIEPIKTSGVVESSSLYDDEISTCLTRLQFS